MSDSRQNSQREDNYSRDRRSRFTEDSYSRRDSQRSGNEAPRESRYYRKEEHLQERSRSRSPARDSRWKSSSSGFAPAHPPIEEPTNNGAEAAAAAARRIAESLQSTKATSSRTSYDHSEGITSTTSASPPSAPAPPLPPSSEGPAVDIPPSMADITSKVIEGDGVFMQDVEINNVRNRYILVRASTLSEIENKSGVQLFSKGRYYPNKALATDKDPPLYLHIVSHNRKDLTVALQEIESWINKDMGPLIDERRFRRREDNERNNSNSPRNFSTHGNGNGENGQPRRKWLEEKVYINLTPSRGFHLRQAIVGPQGAYVKHIQQETRTRVQIKGQGSAFIEPSTNRESDEPIHLCIMSHDPNAIQRAKVLCEDLIASVHQQYKAWKSQPKDRDQNQGNRAYNPPNRNQAFSARDSRQEKTQPTNASPAPLVTPSLPVPSIPAVPGMEAMAMPPGVTSSIAVPTTSSMPLQGMPTMFGAPGVSAPGTEAPGTGTPGLTTPGVDPYAAYGGYNAYVQYYQQQIYAQMHGVSGDQSHPQ
ncbi:KH domain RNA-binding protein, involved in splicing [Schizosaccharomyces pombe]|uniref:Uncharacterized protein C30D11.14c n=1 Tax=Schizosaccharomyces pombe (strain 972 / ATCC 24843) TaxID=284812 RepID=YAJE_SCHPO|nr:putative RNA-binding protein [Schizosaccharomyces pombe]Q09911.1 RecName: Full=Uncharacterized protein C30D11.14c [Schizosaccharomyces pombe 972h-]CAA91900.1 RNA-binding protein (predicted) [Schizosaccharomyces pombe]|eukprot:NP_593203.1 putative RNA-binding protein [Schizosaccharomyces pombe]